jgi:hypothetical protein
LTDTEPVSTDSVQTAEPVAVAGSSPGSSVAAGDPVVAVDVLHPERVMGRVPVHPASTSSASRWTAREAELLAVTLRLLQQHGYDRLTLETVATAAKASKATIYRRWPSKAELVLAAFTEGMHLEAVAPDSGSLREDLLAMGRPGMRTGTPARQHNERGVYRGVAQSRIERGCARCVHPST